MLLKNLCYMRLYEQGVPDKVISERLGHSSIAITLSIYAHLRSGTQKDYINKFINGLLDRNSLPEGDQKVKRAR